MIKNINLGNKESSLKMLKHLKTNKYESLEIRMRNSHIKDLNLLLGRKIFKNDVVYTSASMLWEVMQPLGGRGKHNYHNLTPENVYEALSTMRYSKNVTLSYDNRYVIVTLATTIGEISIAVIVTPSGAMKDNRNNYVTKVITIYPYKKKWEPKGAYMHTVDSLPPPLDSLLQVELVTPFF